MRIPMLALLALAGLSTPVWAQNDPICDYAATQLLLVPHRDSPQCAKGAVEERLGCLMILIQRQQTEIDNLRCQIEQDRKGRVMRLVR